MSLINYGALQRILYFRLPSTAMKTGTEYIWETLICNCTGLSIGADHHCLRLRNSREMQAAAEWLRTVWDTPVPLLLQNISPEYSGESSAEYDATSLALDCFMGNPKHRKPRLYIGTIDGDGAAFTLCSKEATIALSEAIADLAERFDDPESDLFRDTTFADTQD